jgi:long-subunit acyl-CoA synthetase (AMP-forming)
MQFGRLLTGLSGKKGAVITLEGGKAVRHGYADLAADVARAQEQLVHWNVRAGVRVGMFAPNSYAYMVYDLALIGLKAITVPFTDDFAASLNPELIEKYNIALMLLSHKAKHTFGAGDRHIAFIDAENGEVRALDKTPYAGGDEEDDFCLAFSSGSAGGLKGLVISRSGAESTLPPVVEAIGVSPQDRLLLFLPMSNFQQRMMYYASLWYDFDIAVTDYTQLYPALKLLEPSVLIAPPIFYQLTHTRFAAALKDWKTRFASRLMSLLPGAALRRHLARRLFKDVYGLFGGRMRLLISGMAPLNRNTIRFFERVQLPLSESYGMVEAGSLTYRPPFSKKYGSVGKPLRGVTMSFAEDGEIIIHREKFLTRKYFQCAPGENENTFIGANRLATGDVGKFDSAGYLTLLGRKKELIITPGGYKIHPEVLEGELNACADVVQSVVFQKQGVSHLTCVVVSGQDRPEGAGTRIRKYVDGMMADRKVRIGEVLFAEEPFSAQNGMLRPNLKLNRKAIAAKYATAL